MPGTAYSLQKTRNLTWRTVLDDVVHIANVNSQFHGGGADQAAQVPGFEGLFCLHSRFHREAAVVHANGLAKLAEPGAQDLRRLPGVDEDEALFVVHRLPDEANLRRQTGIALQGAGHGIVRSRGLRTYYLKIASSLHIGLDNFEASFVPTSSLATACGEPTVAESPIL